jgi:hypothetical protein
MNKQGEKPEDLLRQYINSERIEKAPSGFTSKVMTRIQIEAVPLNTAVKSGNLNLVPYISVLVAILLIAAAFLIPGSETGASVFPATDFIKNIKVPLPEINLVSILRFNLPVLMMYVFIGILMLKFFDRALNAIFHKGK